MFCPLLFVFCLVFFSVLHVFFCPQFECKIDRIVMVNFKRNEYARKIEGIFLTVSNVINQTPKGVYWAAINLRLDRKVVLYGNEKYTRIDSRWIMEESN